MLEFGIWNLRGPRHLCPRKTSRITADYAGNTDFAVPAVRDRPTNFHGHRSATPAGGVDEDTECGSADRTVASLSCD
jgi:hypothetical protein